SHLNADRTLGWRQVECRLQSKSESKCIQRTDWAGCRFPKQHVRGRLFGKPDDWTTSDTDRAFQWPQLVNHRQSEEGVAQQLNGAFTVPNTRNIFVGGAFSNVGIDPEFGFLQIPKTLILFTPIG